MIPLSLKERTFRSQSAGHHAYVADIGRPPNYKNWGEEAMQRAYNAVIENSFSIRRVYGVPRLTLADRVCGRVKLGSHSGPTRYLSDKEEADLAQFLEGAARMGYAKSKKEVLAIVQEIMALKGSADSIQISNGWWESYKRRHPNLTIRSAEKFSYARLIATDPLIIESYFDLLYRTLDEYHLFDSPAQIFNCDETGMPLDHTPPKVIGAKGQKHPRAVTTGNRKQITVLACCSAAGNFIPPLVIFRRKALNCGLIDGEVPGTTYGLSDRGWMDAEIFYNWFKFHFLKHAPAVRPLLLLMDCHSSHYHPGFIELASEQQIIVFCLPPNTTHMMQPLDKGIFKPLKSHWNQACQHFMRANPGQVVTEYSFSKLFKEAWFNAMTVTNATGAFRTTGVYPFNPSVISAVDHSEKRTDAQSRKLPFIPLISPARATTTKRVVHGSANLMDTSSCSTTQCKT